MSIITTSPAIKNIDFMNEYLMIIHLDNERAFIVPLDKFSSIKKLAKKDRENFEVIDGSNLSFLALDEIFTLKELIGI
ncbi:MAG: DUF2442 domain-containing protein [Anditalea sp.]